MVKRFFELQEKVLSYHNKANTTLLKKAYSVAADAHLTQKRATNEPFIIHPLSVAGTLADMKLDEISVAAGLLHDVVEDTDYTIGKIESMFGKEIADIVWGVTKISKISHFDPEDAKAETLKKMIIAMTNDVRVILIKLADRLHNMATLEALNEEKRKRIARETLEIYAPIAFRLGMGKMKTELEDIAFKYAYPEEYERINNEIEHKQKWAMQKLGNLKDEIAGILKQYKITGEIHSRIKRDISIYRKLMRQNITLDRVYDLLALRIITDSVENCYLLMGEIHQRWQYIPARWRDFIANQKSNGYQSIHTTIITSDAGKFEIQIRTGEMHRIAEEGIAAHWQYKEGINFLENDERLQWFRDMIEAHKENPNPKEFLSQVKGDLTTNEIYVFTPKGKVITLKKGATPIDFAFAIHTEVGFHCKGAYVNEQLVPLRTKLQSSDVVDIITSKNANPSADWLKYVGTSRARKKIAGYIQKKENLIYWEKGKKIWGKIIREYKKKHNLKFNEDAIKDRINDTYRIDMDNFYRDIGSNKRVLDKKSLKVLFPELSAPEVIPVKRSSKKTSQVYKLIIVDGYKDIDILFARCCNPIKGDKITGYITHSRGLMIHKENCSNLKNAVQSRLKEVSWNEIADFPYLVKYDLVVPDKPGMLNSISGITSENNSNIKKIGIEKISQSMCKVKISFEVKDTNQLNKILSDFKKIKHIDSIVRRKTPVQN
ncbi:MAG: bifunctional (p)ppGpp synthetase/guanosine-3',5'-bis(diphosphate) 3'-pyrophosphohydrolase [Candidatus Aminicenantes bacterium]|nr:bifunctional (p)ppGpp synthetase/guanosine-3',5'-bis(diphosphate) 3'-pyrophosphohydrolase [Candidatus Aminicenantes bacterium]